MTDNFYAEWLGITTNVEWLLHWIFLVTLAGVFTTWHKIDRLQSALWAIHEKGLKGQSHD